MQKYSVDEHVDEDAIIMVRSYNGNCYIWNTRDKVLQYNSIPCYEVTNKPNVKKLPKLFQCTNRLKRLLVSRRTLVKVTVMPKGKLLKMRSSICNTPVSEVDVNFKVLARPADSNGLLVVKLKRKLEYKAYSST